MRRTALLLLVMLACARFLAAREPLTVGPLTARPGEKVSGWLEVPDAGEEGEPLAMVGSTAEEVPEAKRP